MTFDTERVGLQNMPECFDASTRELDYLNLFLDGEFWELLCTNTNLYAAQVKASKPLLRQELQVRQRARDEGFHGAPAHDGEDGHQAAVRELLAGRSAQLHVVHPGLQGRDGT